MLTPDIAFKFVKHKLNIVPEAPSLNFLDLMICRFHEKIPFNNVKVIGDFEKYLPDEKEIIEDVLSGRGGLCYTLNVFFQRLLNRIGFDAKLVESGVVHAFDHVATIVIIDDLSYYVDVGSGYPTFSAISLNFQYQTPEIEDSYLRYRFVRINSKIYRDHFNPKTKEWSHFLYFKESPFVDVDAFKESMTRVYTEKCYSIFLDGLYISTFPNGGYEGIAIDQYVSATNKVLNKIPLNLAKISQGLKDFFMKFDPTLRTRSLNKACFKQSDSHNCS